MSAAHLQLAGAALLNVASYSIYKSIVGATPGTWWPMFLFGLMLGALNTFLFTRSLTSIPLSIAFPVFSGTSFALITLISVFAFGEPLRTTTVVGLCLVVGGSFLVLQGN